ncbi:uncharacterized protein isoform X6 [Leptinotarsa decemlineata]|uniref:uncharacterized protein isoform X6 n=1 Tax=Leptinotarsa decemlineata TaxID=7539 RepID=UPI003D309192
MAVFKSIGELCDVVSVVVFCNIDSTMMLTVDNFEHWIPSVKVLPGQMWERTIAKEVNEIFDGSTVDRVLRIYKIWIPRHTQQFLLHVVFELTVDAGVKNKAKNTMGKYRGKLRWVAEADLTKLATNNNLKSSELLDLFYLVKRNKNPPRSHPEDSVFVENLCETADDILVSGKGNIYNQLVEASGIDKLAQETILREFIFMVYPASYMSQRVFAKFVVELGWPKEHTGYLFNAADLNMRNGISFREFLYFLACIDPNTAHGGAAAEIRCRYMFRYYDRDRDDFLKFDEMKNIVLDLRKSKKISTDAAGVAKETAETYKAMGIPDTTPINVMDFLKAICDLKIRGTSTIFRSNVGIIKYLKDSSEKSAVKMDMVSARNLTENLKGRVPAVQTKNVDYEVAVHTVKIQKSGQAINIDEMKLIQGDLHGNVADLLYFERVLWHIGPGLSPSNLLFLGDYVDRGAYSIEVISYLFSYKLQSPNKVNLLRGNHEIREVQKMFTFYKECILKMGEKLGNEVWMAVNNAFDTMPVAAVIDGKLFCCHGGVPPPWLCPVISAINDIPVPLSQPDAQSSLAWELMWNDPVRPKTVNDKLAMELLANEGFAVNVRRGTAHIFSVEALERFLKANQLTHLVRAHEVAQAGFQVQQKGKLLTVFSSSKYCGGQNDAACVMADQGKLRILRLETD